MILYRIVAWLARETGVGSDFYSTGWNDGYDDALADIDEKYILVWREIQKDA